MVRHLQVAVSYKDSRSASTPKLPPPPSGAKLTARDVFAATTSSFTSPGVACSNATTFVCLFSLTKPPR